MKEEEAKAKMCPFQNNSKIFGLCIAEKCMAWDSLDNGNGNCELVHGIPGWLSLIANRLPNGG